MKEGGRVEVEGCRKWRRWRGEGNKEVRRRWRRERVREWGRDKGEMGCERRKKEGEG